MKSRSSRISGPQIAMASALVLVFAGCQVAPGNKAPLPTDSNVSNKGPVDTLKPGGAGAADPNAQTPTVESDAEVAGVVTGTDGKPVAGVLVTAPYGFQTETDAEGRYSMPIHTADRLRLDFAHDDFIPRQVLIGAQPGMAIDGVNVTLKGLDPNVQAFKAAAGGSITGADGNAIVIVPPGALEGDGEMRVTWLDPMPSEQFPAAYGQLQGPNVSRTLGNGAENGEQLTLPPLGFADVQFLGTRLKPGAQATLKMKVNPAALKAAGSNIDFNRPETLQQPCYEYDREVGMWVNPATSKLEKDANGDVWFVYTLHGTEDAKNYKNFTVLGHQDGGHWIQVPDRRSRQRSERSYVDAPAGGYWTTNTWTEYYTVWVDQWVVDYGQHFNGTVKETSANDNFDGQGIRNAFVSHASDFFNSVSKSTGGNGGFNIPGWKRGGAPGVYGASWRGASSTGGGYNMHIKTDGTVKAKILGGSLKKNVSGPAGSTIAGGANWTGDVSANGSRDAVVSLTATAPGYIYQGNSPTTTGTVPVARNLNLGTIHVVRDLTGIVKERITQPNDNPRTAQQNDGDGLDGTYITGFTHPVTGQNNTTTANGGKFKFTLYQNQAAPTVNASFQQASNWVSRSGAPNGDTYAIELRTDSAYTVKLGGVWNDSSAGNAFTLTYKVDGETYTKSVTVDANGQIPLVFARDKNDNELVIQIVKLESADMVTLQDGLPPVVTLNPNGSNEGTAKLTFKAGAVK